MKPKQKERVKALDKRMARASGHSGIICIPVSCIGQTYERYMDTDTGVITLVPCTKEPRLETPEEVTE